MSRKMQTTLMLLMAGLAVAACDRSDNRTAGQQLDSAIATSKEVAKEATAEAKQAVNTVAAEASQATAAAAVATDQALASAKDAAKAASAEVKAATSDIAAKVDDAAITASINAGLAKDGELSALKIDVDTKSGVVTLHGSAPSASARERATMIARSVKGVTAVDNKLTLKTS